MLLSQNLLVHLIYAIEHLLTYLLTNTSGHLKVSRFLFGCPVAEENPVLL